MRRCVAINKEGNAVMMFDTLKEAAEANDLLPDRVRKAIVYKKIVNGYMWLYEEDYISLVAKGKTAQLAWGEKKKTRKRGPMSFDTKLQIKSTWQKNIQYRKKVFASAFKEFSRHHLQWMQDLKDAFLERHDFGIRPEMLADYYTDIRDKEVALVASLLIAISDHSHERVMRFHDIMGEHPWEWFKNRLFSSTPLMTTWEKSQMVPYFSEWWAECFKYGSYASIGECVSTISQRDGLTYMKTMERLLEDRRTSKFRLGVLLLVLSHSDGLGQGLWNVDRQSIFIAVKEPLLSFMATWMPDYAKYGKPDECVQLFGMDSVDFYYCFLAYEALKKVRPKECSAYASFYYEAYMHHTVYSPSKWQKRLPEINFEPKSKKIL